MLYALNIRHHFYWRNHRISSYYFNCILYIMGKPQTKNADTHSENPPQVFPFVKSLYSILSTPNGPISWCEGAENIIETNLTALYSFLAQDDNVFQISNVYDFFRLLHLFGFERITSSDSIKYKHELFRKDSPELMSEVKFNVENYEDEKKLLAARKSNILLEDHRTMTDRCRMQTKQVIRKEIMDQIKFKTAVRMFQLDREISKERAEIPRQFYENPVQSSSNLMRSDFAGYYGLVSDDALQEFFGTYLPVYGADSSEGETPKWRLTSVEKVSELSPIIEVEFDKEIYTQGSIAGEEMINDDMNSEDSCNIFKIELMTLSSKSQDMPCISDNEDIDLLSI